MEAAANGGRNRPEEDSPVRIGHGNDHETRHTGENMPRTPDFPVPPACASSGEEPRKQG